MFSLEHIIIALPILLFSVTFHEFSHAWTAERMGDPTARQMGRLTLNPIPHIDLMGLLVMVGSGFRFGWAKPVPVNPFNFRDWRRGTFLVSLAGPVSNLLLAAVAAVIFRLLPLLGLTPSSANAAFNFVYYMVSINCILAFFNLIPLPPLDGSHLLIAVLPPRYENFVSSLERYGPMILIAVVVSGFILPVSIIWVLIGPFVNLAMSIFIGR